MWEIGCGLAASGPIILLFCIGLLKRLYNEDLVVVLVGFVGGDL